MLSYQWFGRPLYNIAFSSDSKDRMSLSCRRIPCVEASTFSMGAQALPESSPIRVDAKLKCRKCLQNIFLNDRGFADQSNNYNHVLHGMDGGPILWKLCHPQPDLDAPVDSLYYLPFVAEKHKALMCNYMTCHI